jgi:hypothetical protein
MCESAVNDSAVNCPKVAVDDNAEDCPKVAVDDNAEDYPKVAVDDNAEDCPKVAVDDNAEDCPKVAVDASPAEFIGVKFVSAFVDWDDPFLVPNIVDDARAEDDVKEFKYSQLECVVCIFCN